MLTINHLRMGDYGPEKAGVGGSSPSLATMFSKTYNHSKTEFHSVSFQKTLVHRDPLVCNLEFEIGPSPLSSPPDLTAAPLPPSRKPFQHSFNQ